MNNACFKLNIHNDMPDFILSLYPFVNKLFSFLKNIFGSRNPIDKQSEVRLVQDDGELVQYDRLILPMVLFSFQS